MVRDVFFETIRGKKIFSIISEPDKKANKLVIMSHGFRGTSVGPASSFVNFTKILVEKGFSTLRFDQPNCGNSEGDFINVSFREWVNTIVCFANKYIGDGYKVALLGQSMGATASLIAATRAELRKKIPCVLLWVPDPESDNNHTDDKAISEEAGERFHMSFWNEARDMNFFESLDDYQGKIHLVYGKKDKYVSEDLRKKTINKILEKKQKVMILNGEDHSPWRYDTSQKVFKEEAVILSKYLV